MHVTCKQQWDLQPNISKLIEMSAHDNLISASALNSIHSRGYLFTDMRPHFIGPLKRSWNLSPSHRRVISYSVVFDLTLTLLSKVSTAPF
ncbi:hypothetical protein BaRGS_00021992 [Batillaria attramentaria]|uniref:Uncharacterized protein n=1 Tax=Batillaria attramentaria TaxID=370345 RepID=A0ABD0KIJ2_9CAEN